MEKAEHNVPDVKRRRWRYGLKEIALARGVSLCTARYAKRTGELRPWDLQSVARWIVAGMLAEEKAKTAG